MAEFVSRNKFAATWVSAASQTLNYCRFDFSHMRPPAGTLRRPQLLNEPAIQCIRFRFKANCGVTSNGRSSAATIPHQRIRRGWLVAHGTPTSSAVCQATSGSGSSSVKTLSGKVLTLPTILTLGRVLAIPTLVYAWFSQQALACVVLFVAASLTDYLDGYLARRLNASSAFGAFLDPVADKLMVATVLVLLSTLPVPSGPLAGNAWILPVLSCAIIGREITMSALREWAAALGPDAHRAVAVNWLGKCKTATQMISLSLLLASRAPELTSIAIVSKVVDVAGMPLLGLAAVFTVWSLKDYFAGLWRFMIM